MEFEFDENLTVQTRINLLVSVLFSMPCCEHRTRRISGRAYLETFLTQRPPGYVSFEQRLQLLSLFQRDRQVHFAYDGGELCSILDFQRGECSIALHPLKRFDPVPGHELYVDHDPVLADLE